MNMPSVRYFGHVFSADGVKPNPDKICSINDIPTPNDTKSLQRFIGMIQFLGSWLSYLADLKRPLSQLLRDEIEWTWTTQQENDVCDIYLLLWFLRFLRLCCVSSIYANMPSSSAMPTRWSWLEVCTDRTARGTGRAGPGLVFATEKTGRIGSPA
jgi:hypothetical protein